MAGLSLERWNALWRRLGNTPSSQGLRGGEGDGSGDAERLQAAFADLRDRHGESRRAYHTGEHVVAVLAALDRARAVAEDPDCCELALWFHDVIYDVKANSGANESASADHCLATFEDLAGPITPQAERAGRHIRATAHTAGDALPEDPDTRLVLDCDLSILGADAEAFDRYDAQIRVEYAWVPEPDYRAGRATVLQHFLDQPRIYLTEPFEPLEEKARINIARALEALR